MTSKVDIRSVEKNDFDLVFFHTEEYPFKIVQTACASHWCHVALIVVLSEKDLGSIKRKVEKRKSMKNEESKYEIQGKRKKCKEVVKCTKERQKSNVYILESTTDVYACVVTGNNSNGVKMCLLEDRYPTGVCGYKSAIISNEDDLWVARNTLKNVLIPSLIGLPYEENMCNLVKAWVHWLDCCSKCRGCYPKNYDESTMFCTELITHVFTKLNVLNAFHLENAKNKKKQSAEYTDEDLVLEDYVYLERNFIQKGCWLSYSPLFMVEMTYRQQT